MVSIGDLAVWVSDSPDKRVQYSPQLSSSSFRTSRGTTMRNITSTRLVGAVRSRRPFCVLAILMFVLVVMAISLLFDNALRVSAARREQVSDPADGQVLEFPVGASLRGRPTQSKGGAHGGTPLQIFEDAGGRSRHQGQTAGAESSS